MLTLCPIGHSAEWLYQHSDNVGTLRPTVMMTRADNLEQRLAEMRQQSYVIYHIVVHTFCDTCNGSGRVRKSGRVVAAWKPCPVCKGHDGPMSSVNVSPALGIQE